MLNNPKQVYQHKLFTKFVLFYYISIISVPVSSTIFYMQRCDGHLLAGALPICEKVSGSWIHPPLCPCYFYFLCFVQFILTTYCVGGVLVYFSTMIPIVFLFQQMWLGMT